MTKFYIFILVLTVISGLQIMQPTFAFGNYEKNMIFNPINRNIADIRLNLYNDFEDTYFYSLDGIKLNAWYIKANEDKPTIIYCHGQGENISQWQSIAQSLANNGFGVFMLEYRGHGRSQGTPNETGLYRDLESAVKYLNDYKNIENNEIILWGRSLGGAVVADVASRDNFRGIILESTFTNIRDVGIHLCSTKILESNFNVWSNISKNFIRFMPITQKFDTEHKIMKIESPLLIGHSLNDETVPVYMGKELAAINNHSQLFISKKGSHHSSEWFKDRAIKFISEL
jgi:alpha-beta hydrolase superfamily lysophospholipase